jgi:GxxExxY protein
MPIGEAGLLHARTTQAVLDAFCDVYNDLGIGFLEGVYENSIALLLRGRGIRVRQQAPVPVTFRGAIVGRYRVDLLVDEAVLVELKAVRMVDSRHEAQLLNLLRSTGIQVGLLSNCGPRPEVKRRVWTTTQRGFRALPR